MHSMQKIKNLLITLFMALIILGGTAFVSSNNINTHAQNIHKVNHHQKHHPKTAWKKGVPSALRGNYFSKQHDIKGGGTELDSALTMEKNIFCVWHSGTPLQRAYDVRYKKTGHNEYILLYNLHKNATLFGGKNLKIKIIKINSKHIKLKYVYKIKFKNAYQIYHKIKKSYISLDLI